MGRLRTPLRIRSLAFLLLSCLAGLGLSCDDAASLTWLIVFESDADRTTTSVIVAEVRTGGCASDALEYTETYSLTLGDTPAMPGELEPGTYGIFARAVADNCMLIAESCVDITLPQDQDTVTVTLSSGGGGTNVCNPGDMCVAGRCIVGNMPEGGPDRVGCMEEGAACGTNGICRSGSCCEGCWDGTTCQGGYAGSACGFGGAECTTCALNERCSLPADGTQPEAASCVPIPSRQFAASNMSTLLIDETGALETTGDDGNDQLGPNDASLEFQRAMGVSLMRASMNQFTSCGIEPTGELLCWGLNASGSLGVGDTTFSNRLTTPTRVGVDRWREVTAGEQFLCGIKENGSLECWGSNARMQLGRQGGPAAAPVALSIGGRWARVSAFGSHVCAIRDDRTLWCWGASDRGQTGMQSDMPIAPTQVETASDWIEIGSGFDHTCGIRWTGGRTLYCWGERFEGVMDGSNRLGSGPAAPEIQGVVQVPDRTGWQMVVGGEAHSCGIGSSADGPSTLFCWGTGLNGQLGRGPIDADIPQALMGQGWEFVEAGWIHTCGVRSGEFLCWGSPQNGRLGIGMTMMGAITEPTAVVRP
ncbi:MAG: hypothetical protein AAGF12_35810 [Myxococcota bacterium]